jgi:hypothetical protein
MNFRLFLEASIHLPDGGHVLIREPNKYQPGYLDFDNISRHNPKLKEILSDLLTKHPEIASYQLKFDGPGFGSVEEYLKKVSHPKFKAMPDKWYHGTSEWAWLEFISKNGLRPRKQTQAQAAYGANISSAKPSDPNLTYLSDNDGNTVRFAARNANSNAYRLGHTQSRPAILEIDNKGVDPRYFEPDIDSDKRDWQQSLWTLGAVGYREAISPGFIKPHMINDNMKWVKL